MELGNYALQLGARSDCPVGEHPSRQWSSETTVKDMLEVLKCPIHIAIERGHMKMVDLFVRQSLLCTQVIHPISGFLPYRLALSLCILSKTKEEKQRYSHIYLYLYDKQFNLKIPFNVNGGNGSSLSTSSTNVNTLHRSPAHLFFFSLPRYYQHGRTRTTKPRPKTSCKTIASMQIPSLVSAVRENEKHEQQEKSAIPLVTTLTSNASTVQSMQKQKLRIMATTSITSSCPKKISSINKSLLPPTRIVVNGQQKTTETKCDLLTQSEQSLQNSVEKLTTKMRPSSVQINRSRILDIGSHIQRQDHQARKNLGPLRFRFDQKLQQATIKPYERCAGASIHATAIHCLQEAEFFKRKSWIKQVEISKEMVKQHVKRLLQPVDNNDNGRIKSVVKPMRDFGAAPAICTNRFPTAKAY
ncbi:unnamed protein product [Rotaria sp. Silwood1]|nr:unnamed protein product [Rotaria sp. Silwood1]